MPNLTAEQVTELANHFYALGKSIGNFERDNFAKLSPEVNKNLSDLEEKILDYVDNLYTESSNLVIDDVGGSLNIIKLVTDQIKESLKHLENIQKVIDISGDILSLGSALISKNPQAVSDAISKLAITWKQKNKEGD